MVKIPVSFTHDNQHYTGTLDEVAGAGAKVYHLMVGNLYWGRLRQVNDEWYFDESKWKVGHLKADFFVNYGRENVSMKSMWKGSIGFGLVNIPVSMYPASEESTVPFGQYDKNDHAKVRYKKVNENTGKELDQLDIARAYDLNGTTVIVEDSDLAKALPEKIDHLEILQFVDEKEIDAVYYEKPYYLEPEKKGAKAYALLRDALQQEGKVGLGLLVYHNKEWLCLIKAMRKVLVMHRLRFSDEIRSESNLVIPDVELAKDEIKAATQLVTVLSQPFKPEEYKDTYSEKVREVLNAKAKGRPKAKPMKAVHNATSVDVMMQKLKESLNTKRPKRAS